MANDKDYAIVVGIDHYPDFRPLKGAINDARAFYDWLLEPGGGGLPDDGQHCKLVVSEPDPLSPFQQHIEGALAEIWKNVIREEGLRRFYFYFSGHGIGLDTRNVGLCLAKWSSFFHRNLALRAQDYLNWIQESGKFKEVFFFVDCCRVYEVNVEGLPPSMGHFKAGAGAGKTRTLLAYATEYLDKAQEAEMNVSGKNGEEVRGFFTAALLDGLRGAAALPEGGAPLSKLKPYVKRETERRSSAVRQQTPVFSSDFTEESLVVFGTAETFGPEPAAPNSTATLLVQPQHDDIKLTIYDSTGNQVEAPFYGGRRLSLPAGKYFIVSEYLGQVQEQETDVQGLVTVEILLPPQYSSALLEGAASSHEYYTYPAIDCSKTPTRQKPLADGAGSSLMIFLRYPKQEDVTGSQPLFQGFSLLGREERVIDSLEGNHIKQEPRMGYAAFSAVGAPGLLLLEYRSKKGRRMLPLYLLPGWQTQLFITIKEGEPLFESARLFLSPIESGFDPGAEGLFAAEAAASSLLNPGFTVPPSVVEKVRSLQFDNPIFGLLGCYLILKNRILPRGFLPKVLKHLSSLPGSQQLPDLQVLELISGPDTSPSSFVDPPLFDFGLEALIDATASQPALLAEKSIVHDIAQYRQEGLLSGWLFPAKEATRSLSRGLGLSRGISTEEAGAPIDIPPEPWLLNGVSMFIRQQHLQGKTVDFEELARRFRLPPSNLDQIRVHVRNWEFLKGLAHPNDTLPKGAIVTEFYFDTVEGAAVFQAGIAEAPYDMSSGEPRGNLRLVITNRSMQPLHIGMAYLSLDYEVITELNNKETFVLPPGGSNDIFGEEGVPLILEPFVKELAMPYSAFWFKVFFSSTPLEGMDYFAQPMLHFEEYGEFRDRVLMRSLQQEPPVEGWNKDWNSRIYEVRMPNPFLNK